MNHCAYLHIQREEEIWEAPISSTTVDLDRLNEKQAGRLYRNNNSTSDQTILVWYYDQAAQEEIYLVLSHKFYIGQL